MPMLLHGYERRGIESMKDGGLRETANLHCRTMVDSHLLHVVSHRGKLLLQKITGLVNNSTDILQILLHCNRHQSVFSYETNVQIPIMSENHLVKKSWLDSNKLHFIISRFPFQKSNRAMPSQAVTTTSWIRLNSN